MKPQGTALEMMVLHALNLSVSTLSAATHQDHPAPCHPRALNSIPGAASPPQHGGRLSPSYRKALGNGRLIRWHMTLSNISILTTSKHGILNNPQWIGLLGKILTGNPWVFTIKYNKYRALRLKCSHHPILMAIWWGFMLTTNHWTSPSRRAGYLKFSTGSSLCHKAV
jgi:hypothetical protein